MCATKEVLSRGLLVRECLNFRRRSYMARILIFSDDSELFGLLGYLLRQKGHRIKIMRWADARIWHVRYRVPNLVMMDTVDREVAALKLCTELRSKKVLRHVRLMIFSRLDGLAHKTTLSKLVDSQMNRPIDPVEVVRCVRMLTERNIRALPQQPIESGEFVIDPIRLTVERSEKIIPVTPPEFRLLYFLASRPNEVCRVHELVALISDEPGVRPSTVDLLIINLRAKLGMKLRSSCTIRKANRGGYFWKTL